MSPHPTLLAAVAGWDLTINPVGAHTWRSPDGCTFVVWDLDDGHPREPSVTVTLYGLAADERAAAMLRADATSEVP